MICISRFKPLLARLARNGLECDLSRSKYCSLTASRTVRGVKIVQDLGLQKSCFPAVCLKPFFPITN